MTLTKQCPLRSLEPLCAAWSKRVEIFSNVLPNFETIVSSIQRKPGCDCSFSDISFKAIEAVVFTLIKFAFIEDRAWREVNERDATYLCHT